MSEDITRREALKKGALLGGAALVWVRPSVQTYGMSATLAAQASGTAGCTPGFWKTNPGAWPSGISPTDPTPWAPAFIGSHPTMQEALEFGGGGGDEGAERNLFRAAAAGYLNALSLGGYALTTGDLASLVSQAQSLIAAGDRDGALAIAAQIDTENNAGCPIPADESGKDLEDEEVETEQQSDQVFGTEETEATGEIEESEETESNEGGKDEGGDDE